MSLPIGFVHAPPPPTTTTTTTPSLYSPTPRATNASSGVSTQGINPSPLFQFSLSCYSSLLCFSPLIFNLRFLFIHVPAVIFLRSVITFSLPTSISYLSVYLGPLEKTFLPSYAPLFISLLPSLLSYPISPLTFSPSFHPPPFPPSYAEALGAATYLYFMLYRPHQ